MKRRAFLASGLTVGISGCLRLTSSEATTPPLDTTSEPTTSAKTKTTSVDTGTTEGTRSPTDTETAEETETRKKIQEIKLSSVGSDFLSSTNNGHIIDGDTLYALNNGIAAFDLTSQRMKWELALDETTTSIAKEGKTIYINSGKNLLAINTDSKNIIWKFSNTNDEIDWVTDIALNNNSVCFCGNGFRTDVSVFYELDANTGKLLFEKVWSDPPSSRNTESIIIDNNYAYIGMFNISRGYDFANKTLFNLSKKLGFSIEQRATVAGDLLLSASDAVSAVDLSARSELFSKRVPGYFYKAPKKLNDSIIAGGESGIYRFMLPSGGKRWHVRTTSTIRSGPVIIGELAFLVDGSNIMYIVDISAGDLLYDESLPIDPVEKISAYDGKLVISTDRDVYISNKIK